MKNMLFVASIVAAFMLSNLTTGFAQQPQTKQQVQTTLTDKTRVAKAPRAKKVVTHVINLRLPTWKTIHSHNAQETAATVERLQKIGCEVVQQEHNGHQDIRYRLNDWKSFTVTSTDLNQWNTWLKSRGIEIIMLNPPKHADMATVRYRLPQTKTVHMHDAKQLKTMTQMFGMLGCQTSTKDHDGHVDFSVGCPQWQTLGVPTDHTAHVWQDWLKSNGFETQHTHTHH